MKDFSWPVKYYAWQAYIQEDEGDGEDGVHKESSAASTSFASQGPKDLAWQNLCTQDIFPLLLHIQNIHSRMKHHH